MEYAEAYHMMYGMQGYLTARVHGQTRAMFVVDGFEYRHWNGHEEQWHYFHSGMTDRTEDGNVNCAMIVEPHMEWDGGKCDMFFVSPDAIGDFAAQRKSCKEHCGTVPSGRDCSSALFDDQCEPLPDAPVPDQVRERAAQPCARAALLSRARSATPFRVPTRAPSACCR